MTSRPYTPKLETNRTQAFTLPHYFPHLIASLVRRSTLSQSALPLCARALPGTRTVEYVYPVTIWYDMICRKFEREKGRFVNSIQ